MWDDFALKGFEVAEGEKYVDILKGVVMMLVKYLTL